MSKTVADSCESVLTHINGQQRSLVDILDQALTTTGTEILLRHNYADGLAAGQWIEVDDEPMQIVGRHDFWLTVARGATQVRPVTHRYGAKVTLAPPTFRSTIARYLRDEALSLPSNVYSVRQTNITFGNQEPYAPLDTTDDVIEVVAAWKQPTELNEAIRRVRLRLLDGNSVANSVAPYLVQTTPDPGHFTRGATVACDYAYRPKFPDPVRSTQRWQELGFTAQTVSALQYGAAYRALMDREAARAQLSGQKADRRSAEVPPTHNSQTAEMFRRTRAQLISAEAQRLTQTYNVVIR